MRISAAVFGALLVAVTVYLLVRPPMRSIVPDQKVYPVHGVDISSHNHVENWDSVAAAVDFVMIKATEGGNWNDRHFEEHYSNARSRGVKVGAYHFFRFDREGLPQGINFYNSIWNKTFDFPVVIDVEDHGNPSGIPEELIIDRLAGMVTFLEARDKKVMFYTNKQGYQKYIARRFPAYPVWICSLSSCPDPSVNWLFWQYSHDGEVSGVSGEVDLNVYRYPEFRL